MNTFTQVREVLWEARQAAEYAAAARAASIFQRTDDSRQLCVIRREWKKLIRQHKGDILLVRATKAAGERDRKGITRSARNIPAFCPAKHGEYPPVTVQREISELRTFSATATLREKDKQAP